MKDVGIFFKSQMDLFMSKRNSDDQMHRSMNIYNDDTSIMKNESII